MWPRCPSPRSSPGQRAASDRAQANEAERRTGDEGTAGGSQAIVNISLPSIARTFHTPIGGAVEWVIIAHLVVIAATLPSPVSARASSSRRTRASREPCSQVWAAPRPAAHSTARGPAGPPPRTSVRCSRRFSRVSGERSWSQSRSPRRLPARAPVSDRARSTSTSNYPGTGTHASGQLGTVG